jgi:hypothetical protein
MLAFVFALVLYFGLACAEDEVERALVCRGLVESGKRCQEYKTLEEALSGVTDEFERRKITLLYKAFGPTPSPMCKVRRVENWSFLQRRKFRTCERFLADYEIRPSDPSPGEPGASPSD